MFRLKFLAALPPEKRNQLLNEVSKHAASAEVKKVVSLLRESFPAEISNWDVNNFNLQARALLFTPQTDPYADRYAVLLNRYCTSISLSATRDLPQRGREGFQKIPGSDDSRSCGLPFCDYKLLFFAS